MLSGVCSSILNVLNKIFSPHIVFGRIWFLFGFSLFRMCSIVVVPCSNACVCITNSKVYMRIDGNNAAQKKTTRNGNSAKFEYILIMLMASTHCVFPSYCYGWCMPSVVVSVTFYFNQWMELFVWEIMLCVRIERIRRWLFDLFHEWSVSITRTPFLFKRWVEVICA